jgi:hypothetical protein
MSKFIDYKLAIGMLVVQGFKVAWHNHQIVVDGEPVLVCFRDGTTYKVKLESVQDLLEDSAV